MTSWAAIEDYLGRVISEYSIDDSSAECEKPVSNDSVNFAVPKIPHPLAHSFFHVWLLARLCLRLRQES